MHMRTTLDIDDNLLKQAAQLSGIQGRLLSYTLDWKLLLPVKGPSGWRHSAAASRVCGKSGDAGLMPLWLTTDGQP
jgi:hypothetical protein